MLMQAARRCWDLTERVALNLRAYEIQYATTWSASGKRLFDTRPYGRDATPTCNRSQAARSPAANSLLETMFTKPVDFAGSRVTTRMCTGSV